MRNQLIVSVVLVLASACGKGDAKGGKGGGGAGEGGGGGGDGTKVDTAKLGATCSSDFDCGHIDMSADCSWSCVKPSVGDSGPGYCQLETLAATAGAKGCYGNHRGVESSSSLPSEKVTQLVYCDMNAGVYCNMGSHACEAVKAVGAACEDNDECGKDGACQNKACVAAGAPGAAAVEGRCNSSAYKKDGQCIARAADGQPCQESDQCASLSCEYGASNVCVKAKPDLHCAL